MQVKREECIVFEVFLEPPACYKELT